MGGSIKNDTTDTKEEKIRSSLNREINYRITLQYKFKRMTLRNTSTDKLNHGIVFFHSGILNYPRLLTIFVSISPISCKRVDLEQTYHIRKPNDFEIKYNEVPQTIKQKYI